MRTYRCKQCKSKNSTEGERITEGVYRFCSKSCRQEFIRAKIRKQKEKDKEKKRKQREKKANTITKLKDDLWKIVSLYIRLRDSDEKGYCICCTCGIRKHYKDGMQAGHYIPSGSSSFHRYNEKNIHSQCYGCNVRKGGNLIEYRPFMIKKYGEKYTEWLYDTRNELINLGKEEIKELTRDYSIKLEYIKSKKQG